MGRALLCLGVLPWCLPHVVLEGGPGRGYWAYQPYPYAGGADRGYIFTQRYRIVGTPGFDPDDPDAIVDESGATLVPEPWDERTQRFSFRASGEASYVFNDILRTRAAARILFPSRVEVDGAVSFFAEQLPKTGEVETAVLGRAGLSVRFAQDSTAQFRTGVHILHWSYGGDPANGFAGSYGFDFFPGKPVIASVDLFLGVLGVGAAENHALFFNMRGTVGVALGRAEVYVGADLITIDRVSLGGPLMGVRIWL